MYAIQRLVSVDLEGLVDNGCQSCADKRGSNEHPDLTQSGHVAADGLHNGGGPGCGRG